MYYNVVYIQSCRSKKLLGYKMVTKVMCTWCLDERVISLLDQEIGVCTTYSGSKKLLGIRWSPKLRGRERVWEGSEESAQSFFPEKKLSRP